MISGVIMILVAIWVYQSLIKAKTGNLLWWVAGSAALFFAMVFLTNLFCVEAVDLLGGKDIGGTYDPSITEAHDRKTQEDIGGLFLPFVCELLPSVLGFFAVAFVRTRFVLKESLTPANLFSGIKEMFISIKDSFKAPTN